MTTDEMTKQLQDRLTEVESRIAAACSRVHRPRSAVTLVAVSKTVSSQVAGLLPAFGIMNLGESRPQELQRKRQAITDPLVRWHMIGHLQRNKVEDVLKHAHIIHSVDSPRLLEAISIAAKKLQIRPTILLQVNASREEQKHGFTFEELPNFQREVSEFPGTVAGLMGMAAYSDDPETARPAFVELRQLRDRLQEAWSIPLPELSMGMSGDYEVAIEEGSTFVRIGSTIFEGMDAEEPA